MRAQLDRLAAGAFVAVPIGVLAFILLGLLAADHALVEAGRTKRDANAEESSMRVESFLDAQRRALATVHAVFITPAAVGQPIELSSLLDVSRARTEALRAIWVADSSGVIVLDTVFQGHRSPELVGADLDTLAGFDLGEMAARARAMRQTQVSRPATLGTNEPGFVLLDPVFRRLQLVGFVAGAVSSNVLRAALQNEGHLEGKHAIVMAGTDTVVSHPATFSGVVRPPSDTGRLIIAAEGSAWRVYAWEERPTWLWRALVWALGLIAAAVVLVFAHRDARQARSMAERSRELERLSTELLQANRTKSEFLANVSHELRTPLTAIVGFVELLRDGVYGELNPRQSGPVDRIAVSANHLRHLVDQVLDLAKIAAGRLEVHTDPIELRSFVIEAAGELETLVSERGLHLSIAVSGSLPRLRSDHTHVRQILLNLLGNAIKHTAEGTITIRARLVRGDTRGWTARTITPSESPISRPGDWIALQVSDPGVGIASEDLERIFEEFEQVDAGPRGNSMQRGTGLGLSISRRLARILGGDVTAQSEVGKGSTFTLWLPVSSMSTPPRGDVFADASQPPGHGPGATTSPAERRA